MTPYFAIATTVATFLLLLVGALVNPTGSSLACPDWPTCYGTLFPEMVGGILYEHTHRLVASTVGLMTCILAVLIWRNPKYTFMKSWGVLAVGLVIFQGLLGAITVLYKLPLLVSTAHLAISMIFFLLLIYISFKLWHPVIPRPDAGSTLTTRSQWIPHQVRDDKWKILLITIYIQIVLGAFVRHTGSGRACGTDIFFCNGFLLPSWGAGQLHMSHRLIGGVIACWVIVMTPRLWHKSKTMAVWILFLTLGQIALGLLTVSSAGALVPVTTHFAVGTLLLATLFLLYLSFEKTP